MWSVRMWGKKLSLAYIASEGGGQDGVLAEGEQSYYRSAPDEGLVWDEEEELRSAPRCATPTPDSGCGWTCAQAYGAFGFVQGGR